MAQLFKTVNQALAPIPIVGELFKTPKLPDASVVTPPAVEKPAVMPTPDDEAVAQSKRRSIAEQMKRRGRASTILTDFASDKLGG